MSQRDDVGRPCTVTHYFVDEAGDPTLFRKGGRCIVGEEGCSECFLLGLLDVRDHDALSADMGQLRAQLLADPYFAAVPSMQPYWRKTAVAFHAKDDLPEVRRNVYSLLMRHDMRFYAVVRSKAAVARHVWERNQAEPGYRYAPATLCDELVRVLFRQRLHRRDDYRVHFSARGSSDRTQALRAALEEGRQRFTQARGIALASTVTAVSAGPAAYAGLQAVDYFLWALQRMYERNEDRYWQYVWPSVRWVLDLDAEENGRLGIRYTAEKPLSLAALGREPGI